MAFDINLYRLEKARRLAAGVPKYTDLSPTGPTPEDDARVGGERGAAFFHPEAAAEPAAESADAPASGEATPGETLVEQPAAEPAAEVAEVLVEPSPEV